MEDTIVLYSSPEHLNTMSVLAKFIGEHHPVTLISWAAAIPTVPSVTYHQLPTVPLPPTQPPKHHAELLFEIPRLNNPNLRDSLEKISQKSRIKALVLDFFCNAAYEVSTSLGIPTYFYVSGGAFTLCVFLYFPTLDETIPVDIGELNDFVDVPGCPPIHSSDFPKEQVFRKSNVYKHFLCSAENLRKSDGIIVNAFDALEFRAKEALNNSLCIPNNPSPPVYFVGPLLNTKTGGVEHECLKWLDKQPSKSVIFLCFGRRGLFSRDQLKEMAVGLENSGHRFLWSVSEKEHSSDLEGFLERTKDRGFVIMNSWAPQKEVLAHDAVAGFVTHCGRTSVMEAVSFGVPMIGWPLYAEQRLSRVFMVEEMKVALPLDEAADGFVTAAELEKRVNELMDSTAGRAVRHRVKELRIAANAARLKNGSSFLALKKFIASVTQVE